VSLAVDGLAIVRGGRRVVSDVSFVLAPGEILVVICANGAGKTTLLDGIRGFVPRASGRVSWKGAPLGSLAQRARVLSSMPDDADPPSEVSVETLLAYARRYGGISADQAHAL